MCYYNGIKVSRDEFIRLKDLELSLASFVDFSQNVIEGFTFQRCLVIRVTADRQSAEIVPMEWGFIPSYIKNREEATKMRRGYKDAKGEFRKPLDMLNAVGEELLLPRKVYRSAAKERRCLIPVSHFFDWRHIYRINKKTGEPLKTPDKYPYAVIVKDLPIFFLAGIWQQWFDQDTGECIDTFAIVTTEANPLMEIIHNSKKRMPVILPQDLAEEWIFGDLTEERITEIATYQFPWRQMDAHTIAKDFKTTSDDPLAHVMYPELKDPFEELEKRGAA